MARTYGFHLIGRSLGALVATLGLVLVVFLAERMTGFVEMLIERHASLAELPWILALTAPEIVITAMPIAVLIGVYRGLTEARDGGETVALAGAGVGPWGLMAAPIGLGAAAMAFVVVVAGFVDPIARATRDALFLEAAHRMVIEAVRDGLPRDRVQTQDGYTFVSPNWGAKGDRHLLVFMPRDGDLERIVSATNYDLTEIEGTHRYVLRLRDVAVADLRLTPPTDGDGPRKIGGSGYRLGALSRDIDLDQPLKPPVLSDSPQYRTLGALVATGAASAFGLRAAEIVTRAGLSLAAVLAAAIAASFADGRRRFFALPLAGAAMVVFDIALVRVVRGLAGAAARTDLLFGGLALAALLGVLALAVILRYSAVVAARGGRA